jgi:hypothetical protein
MSLFISVALDEGLTNLEAEVYDAGSLNILETASLSEYVDRSGYYHGSLSGDYSGFYEVTLTINDSVYANSYIDAYLNATGVIIGDPRIYDDDIALLNGRLEGVISYSNTRSGTDIAITGFPECFIPGNSYIEELNTNIRHYVYNNYGVAMSGLGVYSFATADVSFTATSQANDTVNFMVGYVHPSGADPYFNIELPAASSANAYQDLEYKGGITLMWNSGEVFKTLPTVSFHFDEDCICLS